MKKKRAKLSRRLTALILAMAIVIGFVTILFGYFSYRDALTGHYANYATNLTDTAAAVLNKDKAEHYINTLQQDEDYEDTFFVLNTFVQNSNVAYLFLAVPTEDGFVYIYDTDTTDSRIRIGELEPWYDAYTEYIPQLLNGQEVPALISDESFGWLLSVYRPFYSKDGDVIAYIGTDLSMDVIQAELQSYLVSLILITVSITAAFVVIYILYIRKTLVIPLNKMSSAAQSFLLYNVDGVPQEKSGITSLDIKTGDELEQLSDSLKAMEKNTYEYISQLAAATERAETDPLTGLHNREAFRKRVSTFLAQHGEEGAVHAFFMLDVDYFKQINDTYGHNIGDDVLQKCAGSLHSIFRSIDEIGRLGGDEFVIFCKNVGTLQTVVEKAQQIAGAWRGISPDGEHGITASIGITMVPKDGMTYKELYVKADTAMYHAKEQGKDRYMFYEDEDE